MSLEAEHTRGSKEKDTRHSSEDSRATRRLEQHPDIQLLAAAAVI